ncbi:MAG: efflux RND transporter periplasmic adaptor subunit [Oscillospiraceae bacterium]|nr:efflux RND transporter periplasmic adaptor subunit [Oscillospiraceae bacterium]
MSNATKAIFIKQFQDILKNSGVMIQFLIFPLIAFLMTSVFDIGMPGMPDSFFITMQAGMFVGMAVISAAASAIAEDREKNSLRFLLMAGVKSHQYLTGVGGVVLAFSFVVCGLFAIMMPDAAMIQILLMMASLMLGAVASVLIGAIIGMTSKSEQSASAMAAAAGMVLGFGSMIANISGSETLQNIFGIFYTMNFVDCEVRAGEVLQNFGIILANVIVFAFIFMWVYGKQESAKRGGVVLNKKVVSFLLVIAIVGGGGIGFSMWRNAGFVATDDALVSTNLIQIIPHAPGRLDRFDIFTGAYVVENEMIGRVEGGGFLRSPVDGVVIATNAVLNQIVSPHEAVAVIADINNVHIQANIEETDVSRLRIGQRAYVTIDALGRQRFVGYISEIGRATDGTLSGNVPNFAMGGTSSRRTQLISVQIRITDDVYLNHLIGANAAVRIPLR